MFTTISELPTDYEEIDSLPEYSPANGGNGRPSEAAHAQGIPAPAFKTADTPKLAPLPRLAPISPLPSEN